MARITPQNDDTRIFVAMDEDSCCNQAWLLKNSMLGPTLCWE
jgi:hypothetical protein